MPSDAPAVKRARVLADGAEIVTVEAWRAAPARRWPLVWPRSAAWSSCRPYDDDRIIAGQGTCGLEIAEDVADLALVLVPIGGGGLASGVAAAVKALRPGARVVGVEPELAADAADSMREGRIVRWDGALTVADDRGRHADPGDRAATVRPPVPPARRRSSPSREAEIAAAVRLAAEESRLVVEPSGALSIAAARFRAGELGLAGLAAPSSPSSAAGTWIRRATGSCSTSPVPG